MFGMVPFEYRDRNLFDAFDKFERSFFQNSLDLKDGILPISAEHTENNDQKDDNGSYIRRERRYGSFRRSFDVTGIDENAITAAYQNGVLELSLPKAQQVIPEARKILIE